MTPKPASNPLADGNQVTDHRRPDHRARRRRLRLNFTSMIDVVFLLLIYFIVTASFQVDEGILTANLPAVDPPPGPPPKILNILLVSGGADCQIAIEGLDRQPQNFRHLATMLEQLQDDPSRGRDGLYRPDNPVVIKPDGPVRWQHVVDAFNATVKARYSNVAFARAGSL